MTFSKRLAQVLIVLAVVFLSVFSIGSFAQSGRTLTDQEWKEVQAAALREGKVVFYGDPNVGMMAKIQADFEKANPGIVLERSRMVGPTLIGKIEADRSTGTDGADIAVGVELMSWYEDAAKRGMIKAPVGPASRSWPAEYLLGGVFPVLQIEPVVMAYNTNLVKTQITGYQDILRPEFKGRVATSEPVALAVIAWYDWLEKTQGTEFLLKFAGQNPKSYVGSTPATQSVISGETIVTAFTGSTTVLPFIEQGAPLKLVVPNPSTGYRYGGALLSWAKRPNAAQVLMDYLMSRRGQTVWAGPGGSASPLAGIPGSLDAKTINPYDPKQYPSDVQKAYVEKWKKIFIAK